MTNAIITRTFMSMCDVCLRDVTAEVVRDGSWVYHRKTCPEHGERRWTASHNGERYTRFDLAYHRLFPPNAAVQPTIDTCFFITNRCNLSCPYCAFEAGKYPYFGDMELDDFRRALAEHDRDKVSLIGGEPLRHPRIIDFVQAIADSDRTLVIYTNGLELADEASLARLVAAAPRLEVRMTFEGFDDDTYEHHSGRRTPGLKQRALHNLERLGIDTVLGYTIPAEEESEITRRALAAVIDFAMTHEFVRGLTFQGVAALGGSRHLSADLVLSVDQVMDRVVEAAPIPIARESTYPTQKLLCLMARLFDLPMCSYVQALPLIKSGRGWVSLDHFFDVDRLDLELDRVVANLPSTRAGISARLLHACMRSVRPRHAPELLPLALRVLSIFARGFAFDSIPQTILPLVSITVCDRHNLDRSVMRRCEKSVQSARDGEMITELCSEMVIRQLKEREAVSD